MEQRTSSWHEWRKAGLGASDAPIVMGVSPWCTPFQLWEQKTGRAPRNQGNWATNRGNELEPKARAQLEIETGLDFPVMLAEHPKFPFMRASLDGWNKEHQIVLEIKCPGKNDHATAVAGKIPEKYWPQLQHQAFVTGAKEIWYYSYDGENGALVKVQPDLAYIKELFKAMCAFWKCVQDDIPPPLTDRDFKLVRNAELHQKFLEWHNADQMLKHWKKVKEDIAASILEHEDVKGRRIRCGDFRVNVITRKGNIQYQRIPELRGVDLEPYRAKPITYQQISFIEAKDEAQG